MTEKSIKAKEISIDYGYSRALIWRIGISLFCSLGVAASDIA